MSQIEYKLGNALRLTGGTMTGSLQVPYLNTTGNLDVGGNINVTGSSIINVDETVTGNVLINGSLVVSGGGAGFAVHNSTNANLIFASGANVGIGNNSPSQKLDVTGTIGASVNIVADNYVSRAGDIVIDSVLNTRDILFRTGATEHVRVDTTSGNFGIGTALPLTKLQVTDASATNVDVLTLENSDITSNVTRSVTQNFVGNDTAGNKKTIIAIRSVIDQINANDGSLHFDTRNENILFPDRMVINSIGNVGLGTASPTAILHVSGITQAVSFRVDASGLSTALTVISGGNVGIGTTAPANLLDVGNKAATSDVNNTLRLVGRKANANGTFATLTMEQTTDVGNKNFNIVARRDFDNLGVSADFNVNNSSANGGAAVTALTMQYNGNVGLGTTAPTESLQIGSSISTNAQMTLYRVSGGTFYVGKNDALGTHIGVGSTASVIWDVSPNPTIFGTNNTERMRIDSGGNVGIGTVAPNTNLVVYENNADTTPAFKIEQASTGDAALEFLLTSQRSWSMGIDNSDVDKFKLTAGGDLDTNTFLTVDTTGNVGIGTTAPATKLHVSGTNSVIQLNGSGININGNMGITQTVVTTNGSLFFSGGIAYAYSGT